GRFAFSKNGQPTIIPLVDGVEIGQRTHLSEKDIAAVKAMYPET
ncbi:M12 family metallopeptidase, partial [Acinetobacter baumannii]